MNRMKMMLGVSLAWTALGAVSAAEKRAELPVLGWTGIPYHLVNVERYRQARDAGFTMMMQWAPSADAMLRALDCAKAADVKLLVLVKMGDEPAETVRRLKHHPALGMYHLGDEPTVAKLPKIGERARKIAAEDPVHPCYLNWCGVVDSDPMTWYGAPNYRAFIAESLRLVPAEILSFDKYPISRRNQGLSLMPFRDVKGVSLNPTWYESLEIVRETSRAAKKPFWAFALSSAHHLGKKVVYPTATVAGMKLQQYSNLAYGAQGLQYFTYWQPVPPGAMEYHDAPVSGNGKASFVLDRIRKVNRELQARAFVFLGADAAGVWHAGKEIPPHTTCLAKEALPDGVLSLETDGGAVVSRLVNGAVEYLMVVNRELERDLSLKVAFESGTVRIREDGSRVSVADHENEYVLSPGDAEIFQLKTKGSKQ